jgi:hypothetical protein
MEMQLPEEVRSSSGQPIFADQRAIRETFLVVVQKIEDDITEPRR